MGVGECLINNDPPGLRERLIQGRVEGKSWKQLGDELGTGSPSATRSAFARETGIKDFKVKGPAVRDMVNGLKEGEQKVVTQTIKVVDTPSVPENPYSVLKGTWNVTEDTQDFSVGFEDWQLKSVDPKTLVSGQPEVKLDKNLIEKYVREGVPKATETGEAVVMRINGVDVLVDGNHRAIAAALREEKITVRFKDFGHRLDDVVHGKPELTVRSEKIAKAEVKVGRSGARPLGQKITSAVWRDVEVEGKARETYSVGRRLVDEVLDIPKLGRKLKVAELTDDTGINGSFVGFTKYGKIEVRSVTSSPGTFIHEFGHHLDSFGFGQSKVQRFATEGGRIHLTDQAAKAIDELMNVIGDTPTIQRIRRMPPSQRKSYLLEPKEQFARGFSQYVTTKVAGNTSSDMIASARRQKAIHLKNVGFQWGDKEFEQLVPAFDNLFRELGWLRR